MSDAVYVRWKTVNAVGVDAAEVRFYEAFGDDGRVGVWDVVELEEVSGEFAGCGGGYAEGGGGHCRDQ